MKILFSALLILTMTSCANSPRNPSKSEKVAQIYFESGSESLFAQKYTEALGALLETVKLQPDFPEAWNSLGIVYLKKNQFAKAETAFKKALSQKESYSDARNNLGLLYMNQKRAKEAEVEFKKTLEDLAYSKAFQTNYNLGLLYENLGKSILAEQQFKLSAEANPGFCAAWNQLGKIQKQREDLNLAEDSFKKATSGTCFNNPEAQFDIASIYLKKNEVSKAKAKLLELIEFFPKSEWAKQAEYTLNMIR
jgi:type IV pilus assembly protein PilF